MLKTDKPHLLKIEKQMSILNRRFGESTLFISQYKENEVGQASIFLNVVGNTDEETYLRLRRLLSSIEYRINKDCDFDVKITIKRKAKK